MNKYPYIFENTLKERRYKKFCITAGLLFLSSCIFTTYQSFNPSKPITPVIEKVVSKKLSQTANSFFVNILEKTENFSEVFYKDNEGIAIAYGWNISKNNKEFNEKLSTLLNFSLADKKLIVDYSNKNIKEVPVSLQQITIKKADSLKIVNYMYYFYLDEFTTILVNKSLDTSMIEKFDNKFNEEEKAVFAHMAYKLGKNNLAKYNKFYSQLIYMLNSDKPTRQDYHNLAQEISYSFRYNGKMIVDEKVQKIHRFHLLNEKGEVKYVKNLTI